MELVTLLALAFALVLVGSSFVHIFRVATRPVAADTTLEEDQAAQWLGELAERREMVMQLILSTELDHQTAKISDEDRDKTLDRLKREAVFIMKQMDALAGEEVDVERAENDLDEFLARARAADGDRQWSAAARVRHGGVHPAGGAR